MTGIFKPGLIVICGPTATGKSHLALHLAQRLGSPILSADSRQVYRGFDIGTAKPSVEERSKVAHHLIDICDPTETFTLAQFQHQAQTLIAQYQAHGIIPLLVGGTGLYIKAVIRGLKIPRVEPQLGLRSQLQDQRQSYGYLQQVDPESAAKIHPNDQVRTLRALEVFYVTGIPLSQQQGSDPPAYPILQLGLDDADIEVRTQRIQQRTRAMIQQGWVAEVQHLIDQYGPQLPLLKTLGYQEIRQYLQGKISLEQAQDLTVIHTRQFAKRQRTWFRADPSISWLSATNPDLLTLEKTIDSFIHPLQY